MPSATENRIPDDEIDLRSVLGRISDLIAYPFRLFMNNLAITLLFVALGVGLAVAFKYLAPKTYSSSFVIRPNDAKEKTHLKIIGDIQGYVKYRDKSGISKELNVPEEIASTLVGLQTYNPSLKSPIDSLNITEVVITTTDYNSFLPLQTGLLSYLENNPYFMKIRKLQENQIALGLDLVEKDLMRLDSLKELQLTTYNKQAASQTIVLTNELINPMATYSMTTERLNKKMSLLAQQKFLDNFQLVKSCVVNKNHSFPPRILVMSLFLVPVFLILCFIYLHNRQKKAQRRVS
jgi:hypothetical protein